MQCQLWPFEPWNRGASWLGCQILDPNIVGHGPHRLWPWASHFTSITSVHQIHRYHWKTCFSWRFWPKNTKTWFSPVSLLPPPLDHNPSYGSDTTSASARISKGQGYQGFLRKRTGSSFGQKKAICIVQGKTWKISLLLGSIKCFPISFNTLGDSLMELAS
jgi:hypothetical protein